MCTINVTARIVLFVHRDGKKIDSKKKKRKQKKKTKGNTLTQKLISRVMRPRIILKGLLFGAPEWHSG